MAANFVWAIDENGKPTKCTAKPENRGKRNCKHRFHANEGESQESFFERFAVSEKDLKSFSDSKQEELKSDTMINENIVNVVENSYQRYDSWEEAFEKNIPDYFNKWDKENNCWEDPYVETKVIEEIPDPNDPNAVLLRIQFEFDGHIQTEDISIPVPDEMNQIVINGIPYRSISQFTKTKSGVVITEDNILLKDRVGNAVCVIDKETGEAKIYGENVDYHEVEKYLRGEDCNLTEFQKKNLDKITDLGKKRLQLEDIDNLRELPRDQLNDISYREIFGYEEKVMFTVGKHMRAAGTVFRRRNKRGIEQNISFDAVSDAIRHDLVQNSNMQIADNLNPIAALTQSEKVSFVGAGSFSKDNVPDVCRYPHDSQRGLIDLNDVSSGGNVGYTIAMKGNVGKDGLIHVDPDKLTGSDFIPFRNHSDPNRASMAVSHMRQACPIVGGEDPISSTKGWDKIKGSKLGVNMTVAYLSNEGTFEDAVVISESVAKRMTTSEVKKYNVHGDTFMYHVGDEVVRGTKIGGAEIKYGGKIKSISNGTVEVESIYPMTPGDKIAGRHGNKGVVSKILPDDQMPKVDGKTADIIMSPIGVAGRGNLGQIYEVNNGDFNKVRDIEYKGRKLKGTGGTQFVMRLNHIAEKKVLSASNEMTTSKEYRGGRFGEMESLIMTSTEDRLDILNYISNQEKQYGEKKLVNLYKALGVDIS